jgi:hypothetical protein
MAREDYHFTLRRRDASEDTKNLADKLHGTVMGLTVVLIFPFGAMSRLMLRHVLSPRSLLLLHVGCQLLGLAMLLTGVGLGAWTAVLHQEVCNGLSFYAGSGSN